MLRVTILFCALLAAAAAQAAPTLANPASVLCVKNGAKIEVEAAPNGGQHGICVFPDGTRIEEWVYFRNKHRTKL